MAISKRFLIFLAVFVLLAVFIIRFLLFTPNANCITNCQPVMNENYVIFNNNDNTNNNDNNNNDKVNWSALAVDVSDLKEKLPNTVFYVRTKPIAEPNRRCSQTITGRRIAINYANNCCKKSQPRKLVSPVI